MPLVDFDVVLEEAGDAAETRFMTVLVRSSLVHGADNIPAVILLTDKTLFFGGSEATGGKYHRVPLRSITASAKAGGLLWECVMVRHMDIEGEKTVYLCPFTGSPASPAKDRESLEELLSRLRPA
jgi:hypothetical protein